MQADPKADPAAPKLDDNNPWPGLAAYDEGSRRFFHGREEDSAELLRLIRLSPFVLLYGKSGLGKSSMLQAGVFPELRTARFLPVYLRPDYSERAGTPPLLDQAKAVLWQEIKASGADAPAPRADESLWAYLQRREWPVWTRDNFPVTPVLVFDQFEELFSRGASEAHVNKVLESLADLVGDRLPAPLASDREKVRQLNLQAQQYRVVLSFRSDFLAEVEAWEKQANLPRRESLHLTAMSRERAIDAVQTAGAAVLAPGVAAQIVDFLLSRDGDAAKRRVTEVEPVLLSLCCYQLNLVRGAGKIDAKLLQGVGEDILKGFYRDALKGMEPRVSVFIEENLILGERYRNSYPRAAAVEPGNLTEDELGELTKRRLLRVDPQGGEPRVELIHDRLVGVVREARDERRAQEALQQEREQAEAKARTEREQAEQAALAQRERERLAQAEAERGRLRRWRQGLIAAVAVLVALSGGLIWSRNELGRSEAGLKAALELATRKSEAAEQVANEARGAVLASSGELAKVRDALIQQQQAVREAVPNSAAVASGSSYAAVERANDVAMEALRSVAVSEQRLQVTASQFGRDEPAKGTAAGMAAPSPAPATPAIPRTSPAPAPNAPAAAGGANVPADALPLDWRLSSGGCLKGDVAVTGTARFWIEAAGNDVIVRQRFEGKGNGFTVTVTDTGKAQPRSRQGYYDIETRGDWSHPNGRKFASNGVDRVWVGKDGLPTRASLFKFKTECPY
ncbi:MAG: hypothetical protein AD742_19720 [Methylibium sp. NZG]|nr:MAG: hypothetical protein AD742_19720 [Methylibium sp. NZG]